MTVINVKILDDGNLNNVLESIRKIEGIDISLEDVPEDKLKSVLEDKKIKNKLTDDMLKKLGTSK